MGSFLTNATGTGNGFAAQAAPIQGQDFTGNLASSQGQYNQVFNNQNTLGNILMNEANGSGPNPAALETQHMNENAIKSNAGMVASQQGISPALAARLAAQNSAGMQQQAAGQGALQNMNQQLAVQGALGNLYGQQAGEANTMNSTNQNALAAYNTAQVGSTSNQNNTNQATSAQNAATSAGMVGGLAKGLSAGLFAKGGVVPAQPMPPQNLDVGGPVIQNWGFGGGADINSGAANMASKYISAGGDALEKDLGGSAPLGSLLGGGGGGDSGGGSMNGMEMAGGPMDAMGGGAGGGGIESLVLLAASGGEIPEHLDHMAKIYHPDFSTAKLKSQGGNVPGTPQVPGKKDTVKNDTVATMLSPGEIVLPRSVTQSKDPVKAAADFVAEKLRSKKGSGNHSADFHDALSKAIQTRKAK